MVVVGVAPELDSSMVNIWTEYVPNIWAWSKNPLQKHFFMIFGLFDVHILAF